MDVGIIERAYFLARNGECRSMSDLKRQLGREGYPGSSVDMHLRGKFTKDQLSGLMTQHASSGGRKAASGTMGSAGSDRAARQ